jgi:phenylpropionate dioxygenase-like ring-hydroxylating dioxygenase large terminal subunit
MSGAAEATQQTVGAEMLRGFWYPAAQSDRIRGQQLLSAQLLGEPLVLGRDANGKAFA